MEVYTDGATSNNGYEGARGGWAYIILEGDKIIKEESGYVPEATNNICELTALIRACETLESIWGEHTIYSDSAYCINCYKQKWYEKWERNGWKTSNKTPVANEGLWRNLVPFFRNSLLKFEKVSAHSGNRWNEYVDKLAVEAKEKIDG